MHNQSKTGAWLPGRLKTNAWLRAALFGLAYFASAELGQFLSFKSSSFATFWPPGGLYVAALLLSDTAAWPLLVVAAFPTSIAFDLLHGRSLLVSFLFACANNLEALAGAWLVRRFTGPRPGLSSLREVISLLGLSAAASTALGAAAGAAVVTRLQGGGAYWDTWLTWWASNMLGVAVAAPFFLTWLAKELPLSRRWSEILMLLAGTSAAVWVVFVSRESYGLLAREYLLLPFVVWAALRFRPRAVATLNLVTALAGVWATSRGYGELAASGAGIDYQVWTLQAFLGVMSATGLMLAAIMAERKRAEESLRQSEERYRILLETSPDAINLVGLDGSYLAANSAMLKFLGFGSLEELQSSGLGAFDFIAEQDRPRALENTQRTLEQEAVHNIEYTARRRDGSVFPIELSASVVRDAEGNPYAFIGVTRDIAERKQGEEALRRQAMTFENMFDAVILTDAESRIVDWNPAAVRMFGYSRAEVLGQSPQIIHRPTDTPALQDQIITRTIQNGRWAGEVNFVRKDGTEGVCEVVVVPVRDAAGKLVATVGVNRDITERKLAEQELGRRTAQLEALRQVGLELTAQLDLDVLLRSITMQAAYLLKSARSDFHLYHPQRDVLEHVVHTLDIPGPIVIKRGEGLAGKVLETGRLMVVDDYQNWEGRSAAYERYHAVTVVGVPVRWGAPGAGGGLLGVLVAWRDTPHPFSQADIEWLEMFAAQAAIAIRNARLYEMERKRAVQLAVINRVTHKASSILETGQLLPRIAADIQQGFGYHNVTLLQLDQAAGEVGRQAMAGGFEHMAPPDYTQQVGEGIIGWVAQTGQPLMSNDVSQDPRYIVGFPDSVPTRSELCVPIRHGERILGVLDIQEVHLNAFDQTDLTAMEILADQIAVALTNARLFEQVQRDAQVKSDLLLEINHRVKNNLMAILGLLITEQRYAPAEGRRLVEAAMGRVAERIKGLLEVHTLLSKTQWQPVRLSSLVSQVIRAAFKAATPGAQIKVNVSDSPVEISPRQANNLALVVNELAINTLNHAIAGRTGACIGVRIKAEAGMICIEYRDDGPGYPEAVLRLESPNVGMNLIRLLVTETLRGTLTLANDGGAVATLCIRTEEKKRT